MEPVVIRPAQPSDATDLARNWIDVARHYVELGADAFQLPAADGLVAGWAPGCCTSVEAWGRGKGAVRSVLTTYHSSPLSVPFYEQGMGYERRSIVFEKRLD